MRRTLRTAVDYYFVVSDIENSAGTYLNRDGFPAYHKCRSETANPWQN